MTFARRSRSASASRAIARCIDSEISTSLISTIDNGPQLAQHTYCELGVLPYRPAIFVATYFGELGAALPALARTPIEAIGVDLVPGRDQPMPAVRDLADKTLVAGSVDGRNIWRTDLQAALATLGTVSGAAHTVAVSTLHVPYSLEAETDIDARLRGWLSFGAEKVAEVVTLAKALRDGRDAAAGAIEASNDAVASRTTDPRLHNAQIRARIEAITASGVRRGPAERRRAAQDARLRLPPLPTTTIGSSPQTPTIRKARAALLAGQINRAQYTARMKAEVAEVIGMQEQLGLDVLVHGEPERNDMVQARARSPGARRPAPESFTRVRTLTPWSHSASRWNRTVVTCNPICEASSEASTAPVRSRTIRSARSRCLLRGNRSRRGRPA
ncbi:hypothetical protein CRM90_06640 [Mycobacterium sp. ENV421]|nr:hypothetical protein CRM90_06640 [Mycobacterium sp. ENV421]